MTVVIFYLFSSDLLRLVFPEIGPEPPRHAEPPFLQALDPSVGSKAPFFEPI